MAARPTWKGYLKVSLVTIPVRVYPATESAAALSFNQLHAECQTKIQQKKWCPTCQMEVTNDAIVKGYEFEKGKYALIEEDDIAKVRPESTRVINVVQFTDAKVIDPVYVERPYYLGPDGQVAADAFAVMREGMEGKAAVGKLALYGREYLVAIQPRENGFVMYTLRHAAEVGGRLEPDRVLRAAADREDRRDRAAAHPAASRHARGLWPASGRRGGRARGQTERGRLRRGRQPVRTPERIGALTPARRSRAPWQ